MKKIRSDKLGTDTKAKYLLAVLALSFLLASIPSYAEYLPEYPLQSDSVQEVQTDVQDINTSSSMSDILKLQRLLFQLNLVPLESIDGIYNDDTTSAVLAFQRWVNTERGEVTVEANGMADVLTLMYLQYSADNEYFISASWLSKIGYYFYENEAFPQSAFCYEKASTVEPTNYSYASSAAMAFLAYQNYDGAIDMLKHCIAVKPDALEPYVYLLKLYENKDIPDDIIVLLRQGYQLTGDSRLQFASSPKETIKSVINTSDFRYALTNMCKFLATGFPEGEWDYSDETKEVVDEFIITYADNVRIVSSLREQTVYKVSVTVEYNNNSAALKELAVISVIEGKLFQQSYITNSDKHKALQYAQDLMDAILYLNSDNISSLYDESSDITRILAANGREYDYYWELIDDSLFISVNFGDLPNGVI